MTICLTNPKIWIAIIARGEKLLKVSVKGSQDGSWGLTQSHLKDANYHAAVDLWLGKHKSKTVLCFVQFKNTSFDELPRVYLAMPAEVAQCLKETAKGRGDTILYEKHRWDGRAHGAGTTERIPNYWRFSEARVNQLLEQYDSEKDSDS